MDYLAFVAVGETFAVSLDRVREVSPLGPVTRVPGAPPALRGLMGWRGAAVPIVDVSVVLGLGRASYSRRAVAIHASALVEGEATAVGLMVDRAERLLSLDRGDLLAVPAGLPPGVGVVIGFGGWGGRLVPILDVDGIVALARATGGRRRVAGPAAAASPDALPPARAEPPAAVTATTTASADRPRSARPIAAARTTRPRTTRPATAIRSPPSLTPEPRALPRAPRAQSRRGEPRPPAARTLPATPRLPTSRDRRARAPRAFAMAATLALALAVAGLRERGPAPLPARGASALTVVPSVEPARRPEPAPPPQGATASTRPVQTVSLAVPAPRDPALVHEVRPGDTLWALSRRYYGDPFLWRAIFVRNRQRIAVPDLLLPGQRLGIPPLPEGRGELSPGCTDAASRPTRCRSPGSPPG